ncbi:MAG TPA: hypothetical protein VNN80_25010 [Polyangiaceae bacterium]|nr:hypothetical protein [Polyangiaceae bacterium]
MRSTNSQANGSTSPREAAPGSHLARRRGSDARFEAVTGKRREESGPPTKPSIAPPSARPIGEASPLGDASPLVQLERVPPTLTYGVVCGLAALALALGALTAFWSTGQQQSLGLASTLWFVSVSTLVFSSSMAALITLSFMRRLRVLAYAAWRLAEHKSDSAAEPPRGDAVGSLAHSVTHMAERISALVAELEQCVEEEQARVDELVRERTRALALEAEDYRRLLGEAKGLLTLDREGRVVAQSSVLEQWLGSMPRTGPFWEYVERASTGAGALFEAAWSRAVGPRAERTQLALMPTSLRVGQRELALAYRAVHDPGGALERVLVVVSDVTVPEPDPATPSVDVARVIG